jgi:hypothetical protein
MMGSFKSPGVCSTVLSARCFPRSLVRGCFAEPLFEPSLVRNHLSQQVWPPPIGERSSAPSCWAIISVKTSSLHARSFRGSRPKVWGSSKSEQKHSRPKYQLAPATAEEIPTTSQRNFVSCVQCVLTRLFYVEAWAASSENLWGTLQS